MSREGLAVLVNHLVGVAVVSGDYSRAALSEHSVNNLAYAGIDRLNSLNSRLEYTCMTYHIAVCEVEHYHIVLAALNRGNELVGNLISAHLGLQIVCSYRGRFNENSVLAVVLLLNAAVEEEGYVSVLLGLGNSELLHTERADVFAHCVNQGLRLKRDLNIRHCSVVLRHTYIVQGEHTVSSLEAVKVGVNKSSGDFTRSVGAEVVENNAVVSLERLAALDNGRNYELIGNAVLVALFNRANGTFSLYALAVNDSGIRLFYALPAVISVHRVVTSHNGSDFAHADFVELSHTFLDVACRR